MTTEPAETLFAAMRRRGWRVELQPPGVLLPPALRRRFRTLPAALEQVLAQVVSCINPPENAWLLGPADYACSEAPGFCWNSFERMSLEANGELRQRRAITAFWDQHFPFMQAVHSDYDYLALSLAPANFARVVHGCAPEWEEISVVAPDLASFVAAYVQDRPAYPLSLFV